MFVVILFLSMGMLLFLEFGGSIWRPIKSKLTGGRTTAGVLRDLKPVMQAAYPNLNQLTNGKHLTIYVIKDQRVVELWKEGERFKERFKVLEFPFKGFSGKLGPKLVRGDGQIPEGIYAIEYLNPNSSFHLSMKLDYPNEFDRQMARKDNRNDLGDDIFIHGGAATVGCIPIGDPAIEVLFYLVAANGYKNCSVVIVPVDIRNGDKPPEVDGIGWEAQLYRQLGLYTTKYFGP